VQEFLIRRPCCRIAIVQGDCRDHLVPCRLIPPCRIFRRLATTRNKAPDVVDIRNASRVVTCVANELETTLLIGVSRWEIENCQGRSLAEAITAAGRFEAHEDDVWRLRDKTGHIIDHHIEGGYERISAGETRGAKVDGRVGGAVSGDIVQARGETECRDGGRDCQSCRSMKENSCEELPCGISECSGYLMEVYLPFWGGCGMKMYVGLVNATGTLRYSYLLDA